jgi:hypothetical protein
MVRREAAIDLALARFPAVTERFSRAYGMRLPKHLADGAAFFLGLSDIELSLCPVSLAGVGAWFLDGALDLAPVLDERLHMRYRRDPPEFVTVASGDGDGSHWALTSSRLITPLLVA